MVRTVVVTGCDSGFGNIAAKRLAADGWHVVAGCFTEDGVKALKAEKTSPGSISPARVDVTDDKSVADFAKVVEGHCKEAGLDGLINNAGIAPTGYVEWAPLSDLQKAMDINVYGQIRMTKACCALIRKAKGRIVNVSSICGRLAFGGAGWYSCTKFACEGWTDSLRREMQPFGVSVHLIEPGFFQTNMVNVEQYAKQLKVQFDNLTDEQKKAYGEQTLTGYVQNIKDQVDMLADPDAGKVVTAMVEALNGRFAKTRYPVGGSARFLFMPISHMPTWIADGILAGMNQKYKPDGKVSGGVPRRLDLVALWLVGVPAFAYGLCTMGYSRVAASATSSAIAWCLSWKMS
jgi:NAD(P)-dependent dehydrogenase (short-subunit alcohol dehydrogenase family)